METETVNVNLENYLENYKEEQKSFWEKHSSQIPGWLYESQEKALLNLCELGFPTKKGEDFRHTNIIPFVSRPLKYLEEEKEASLFPWEEHQKDLTHPQENLVVFVNGVFAPQFSRLGFLDKGVQVSPLKDLKDFQGEGLSPLIKPHLQFHDSLRQDAFSSLNQAFLKEGVAVVIGEETQVENPIHLLYLTSGDFQDRMVHPRNIILMGKRARAQVVETYFSLSDHPYLTNVITDIHLQTGAELFHIKLQLEGKEALHMGQVHAKVPRDAFYHSFAFSLGGKVSRNTIQVALEGEGAQAQVDGLYALRESQQADTYSFIDHVVPHTTSSQLYKGILDGKSHGVFKGKIMVRKGAQKTSSQQLNKNLLLNNLAHVDTQPQLLIYADDVKCTHGATIGQMNEDEFFYLQSRGIPKARAKRLLAHAFLYDIILKVPGRDLHDRLGHHLFHHFEKFMNSQPEA